MVVIFPVCGRIELLPYFLHYYTSIGATRFVCGLHRGAKSPLYAQIKACGKKYNLTVLSSGATSYEKFNAQVEARGLNKIRRAVVGRREWYVIADLDEFHYFKGKALAEVIQEAEAKGCRAVEGRFRDRIAADGRFPEIRGPLDKVFPLQCLLTKCAGLTFQKIVLAQGGVAISPGHHKAKAKVLPRAAWVHHFKWSKGVDERVAQTYERYKKQGRRWAIRHLPDLLALIKGGVDITGRRLEVEPAPKLGV